MHRIQVGDRQLIFSETFLLADNEVAHIEVPLGSGSLAVRIRFEPSTNDATGRWRFENNVLIMDFSGWNNPLGVCLTKPARIGDVEEKPLGFTVAQQKVGQVNNLITLQFYIGGTYE